MENDSPMPEPKTNRKSGSVMKAFVFVLGLVLLFIFLDKMFSSKKDLDKTLKGNEQAYQENNKRIDEYQKTADATQIKIDESKKSWHVVKEFKGNGMKNTEPFDIQGNQWRANWKNTGNGNFVVSAESATSAFAACSFANIIGNGSDTSYCYESGNFHLNVMGDKWAITVEDFY